VRGIALLVLSLLSLTACTTRTCKEVAHLWQEKVTQEVVDGVALSPGVDELKPDKWTDATALKVLAYIDDLTTYAVFVNPCCDPSKTCTPKGLAQYHFVGHCGSLATYCWCVYKYLDYPYDARIRIVSILGISHFLFLLELPSGNWVCYNTAKGWGILDEPFYRIRCEFDTQHYWALGEGVKKARYER